MASGGKPSLKGIVEVGHGQPLFPRENYEVVLENGLKFDPCTFKEDFRVAFRQTLSFWEVKHRENGSLLEYNIFEVCVDRKKAICVYIETFYGTKVDKIIRRVHQFESVLDMHLSMSGDFQRIHPGISVWARI